MEMLRQNSFEHSFDRSVWEVFSPTAGGTSRTVHQRLMGQQSCLSLPIASSPVATNQQRPADCFYQAWLRQTEEPVNDLEVSSLSIVDLFSGCGGMSVGLGEAASAMGINAKHLFAAEHDQTIAKVYQRNLKPENLHVGDISKVFDGVFGETATDTEGEFVSRIGEVGLLCGGPPCQGHSDLNNYTRRNDPRNSLYFLMARAAELLRPRAVIIENVPGVKRDRTGNFGRTIFALEELGYSVEVTTLNAKDYGVPQSRKRTFVFAAENQAVTARWKKNLVDLADPIVRTPLWSIGDLLDVEPTTPFDQASNLSAESRARVDWLFENSKYELDDSMRPDCHRLKSHSYNSVYGRMRENTPAPTMTTGFLVMGQGRFIHPTRRRTITPHEGARIQTFPDYFDFGNQKRGMFARMIGNAVPPLLAYYVGLASMEAIIH